MHWKAVNIFMHVYDLFHILLSRDRLTDILCVCVCGCVCVRAYVRACARARRVCGCACVCVRARVRVCFFNKFIHNMFHYRGILHVLVYTLLHNGLSIAVW